MTPREEFVKELSDLLFYAPYYTKRGLGEDLFGNFIEKWAPKDTPKSPKIFVGGVEYGSGAGKSNVMPEKEPKDDTSSKHVETVGHSVKPENATCVSRRDYFAAAALQALLGTPINNNLNHDEVVTLAREYADDLIEELDKDG